MDDLFKHTDCKAVMNDETIHRSQKPLLSQAVNLGILTLKSVEASFRSVI